MYRIIKIASDSQAHETSRLIK